MRGTSTQANANSLLFGTRNKTSLENQVRRERDRETIKRILDSNVMNHIKIYLLAMQADTKGFEHNLKTTDIVYHENQGTLEGISVIFNIKEKNAVCEIHLDQDFKLHKAKAPAIKANNGCFAWFSRGVIHRRGLNNPAVRCLEKDGSFADVWYRQGKQHRDGDNPSYIKHKDGQTSKLEYHKQGKLHRETGPAVIDGEIEERYTNGTPSRPRLKR